jgi:serine/threonine protein kinase
MSIAFNPVQKIKLRKRMLREARIAKQLDHPTITHYFGLFVKEVDLENASADFYLVSDYVDGGLAKDYLRANRTPQVAEKLVSALNYGYFLLLIGSYREVP